MADRGTTRRTILNAAVSLPSVTIAEPHLASSPPGAPFHRALERYRRARSEEMHSMQHGLLRKANNLHARRMAQLREDADRIATKAGHTTAGALVKTTRDACFEAVTAAEEEHAALYVDPRLHAYDVLLNCEAPSLSMLLVKLDTMIEESYDERPLLEILRGDLAKLTPSKC